MLNSNIVFIDNIETEEQAQMLNERLLNMIGVHTAVSYTHLTLPTICSV